LTRSGTTVYLGDYDYYVEKKQEEAEIKRLDELEAVSVPKQEAKATEHALSYKEQKQLQSEQRKITRRIAELEEQIELLETEYDELEQQMTLPEVFEDHELVMELTEKTAALKKKIEDSMEEWTELSEA